jgi:hypothetical protein
MNWRPNSERPSTDCDVLLTDSYEHEHKEYWSYQCARFRAGKFEVWVDGWNVWEDAGDFEMWCEIIPPAIA